MRTRAQAKRAEQQQQKDDAATAASGAHITNPDDIPARAPANPADRPAKAAQSHTDQQQFPPDYTVLNAPFTAEELKSEQQADEELQQFWDLAKDPIPTEYVCKAGILYWIQKDPHPLDNPHKIVVPKTLRDKVLHLAHSCSGHFGAKKTLLHIRNHFTWPWQDPQKAQKCFSPLHTRPDASAGSRNCTSR